MDGPGNNKGTNGKWVKILYSVNRDKKSLPPGGKVADQREVG